MRESARDPALASTLEAAIQRIMAAFEGRILPVDKEITIRWGVLLGQSEKNVDDAGLAATAYVYRLVVTTRNVSDV